MKLDMQLDKLQSNKHIKKRQSLKNHNSQAKIKELGVAISQELYSGPIPHPDFMQKYNEIDPTIVPAIMRMAENSVNTKCDLLKKEQKFSHTRYCVNAIFAFLLILITIFAGTYLISIDKTVYGFIFLCMSGAVAFIGYGGIFKRKKIDIKK